MVGAGFSLSGPALSRREFLPLSLLAAVSKRASFVPWYDASPLFSSCRLINAQRGMTGATWPEWIARHDADIRSRLLRGEEDSLVNFVLYGVSFTSRPRGEDVEGRIKDFVGAVRAPGTNERLIWLRHVVKQPAEAWVQSAVSRYLSEQQQYARDPNVTDLYQSRGLSVDTNFRPNWAIEIALADLKRRGVLQNVKRAAVIGPGLDFADKDRGYDYYPLQTLQPFALVDSLLRLDLARNLRVSVFDISEQTLDHLEHAKGPCTIQLVLDRGRSWNPDALAYWRRFGDLIGTSVEPLPAPPQVGDVDRMAVRIRPEIVGLIDPSPLNVVTQRASERFDLIVATNILVYYDEFERALASTNISAMLADGGVFLANSPLPECPALRLHSTGRIDVKYSNEPNDGDRVQIYSSARFSRPLGPL
jgi:hypothetical protein